MIPGTDNFAFRQNTTRGGQPIAQSYASTKVCTFHGDCQIPNMYNKTSVDTSIANIYDDTYTKTEIDILIPNLGLSNYYIKSESDIVSKYRFKQSLYESDTGDIDNELSALISNTYTKTEVDTLIY